MSTVAALPTDFSHLERFIAFTGATETARNHHRIDCTQDELDAFVSAVVPRLEQICAYLDSFPLDALPPDAQKLYYLMLSVAEAAPSVEGYRAPSVPYGYDSRRFQAQEDFPLRPGS